MFFAELYSVVLIKQLMPAMRTFVIIPCVKSIFALSRDRTLGQGGTYFLKFGLSNPISSSKHLSFLRITDPSVWRLYLLVLAISKSYFVVPGKGSDRLPDKLPTNRFSVAFCCRALHWIMTTTAITRRTITTATETNMGTKWLDLSAGLSSERNEKTNHNYR